MSHKVLGDFPNFITEERWESLLKNDPYFKRTGGVLVDCRSEFGRLNIFGIVEAADLLVHQRGGVLGIKTSLLESSMGELRKRVARAFLKAHTDRIPNFNDLPDEEKLKFRTRATIIGVIKGFLLDGRSFGGSPGGVQEYFDAMDRTKLWSVEWDEGTREDTEFERSYGQALSEALAQMERYPPPIPESSGSPCCLHCGSACHSASYCPSGGSWHRDTHGRFVRRGGHPLCFLCLNYTDHPARACPNRHPRSLLPVYNCWNCYGRLQGRDRFEGKCTVSGCGAILRCYNCGEQGHRIYQCSKERYVRSAHDPLPRELRQARARDQANGVPEDEGDIDPLWLEMNDI